MPLLAILPVQLSGIDLFYLECSETVGSNVPYLFLSLSVPSIGLSGDCRFSLFQFLPSLNLMREVEAADVACHLRENQG